MGEFIRLAGMVIILLLWGFFMAMSEGIKNLLFKWRYKWIFWKWWVDIFSGKKPFPLLTFEASPPTRQDVKKQEQKKLKSEQGMPKENCE